MQKRKSQLSLKISSTSPEIRRSAAAQSCSSFSNLKDCNNAAPFLQRILDQSFNLSELNQTWWCSSPKRLRHNTRRRKLHKQTQDTKLTDIMEHLFYIEYWINRSIFPHWTKPDRVHVRYVSRTKIQVSSHSHFNVYTTVTKSIILVLFCDFNVCTPYLVLHLFESKLEDINGTCS